MSPVRGSILKSSEETSAVRERPSRIEFPQPRKTPREWGPKPLPSRDFRPCWDYDPEGFSQLGPETISRPFQVRLGVAPESAEKP